MNTETLRDRRAFLQRTGLFVGSVFVAGPQPLHARLLDRKAQEGKEAEVSLSEDLVCGALILMGLITRLAALPLILDMLVAISTTKIPILIEKGFWAMAHEARTDWSMLLGAIVLTLVGAWSLDALLHRRTSKMRE